MKSTYPPTVVSVEDKHHEALFPRLAAEERIRKTMPSERLRMRAAAVVNEQRDACRGIPATTVRDDLQAVRRRPLDAPMATPVDSERPAWEQKSYLPDEFISLGVRRAVMVAMIFIAGLATGRLL